MVDSAGWEPSQGAISSRKSPWRVNDHDGGGNSAAANHPHPTLIRAVALAHSPEMRVVTRCYGGVGFDGTARPLTPKRWSIDAASAPGAPASEARPRAVRQRASPARACASSKACPYARQRVVASW